MKRFLLILSLFSCLFISSLSAMKYLQTITVSFPGELPMVIVDHQPVKCHCGKKPVQIHVLNGIVRPYCEDHRVC